MLSALTTSRTLWVPMASTLSLDPSHLAPEQMSFALGKDFCPPVWSEMCFIIPGTESREGVLLCLGEQFLFFFLFSSTFLPSCSAPVITDSHRQQGAGKVFYQYPKPQAGWLTPPLSLWAPSALGLQDNLTVPLVFSS